MLIDTHAHLDFNDFDNDRDEVIERAEKAGVSFIINPGCDLATSKKAIELSETCDSLYAAVGIHPNSTADALPGDSLEIARLAENSRVVAIGETGLDFYRDRSPREIQVRAFRDQLGLARELDLPVIIHFRNVGYDGIELVGIDNIQGLRGVFHCFGGSVEFAREIISMGFYIQQINQFLIFCLSMKILLINPNRYRTPPVPPLALEYLHSALRDSPHECRILDLCFSDDSIQSLEKEIHNFNPDETAEMLIDIRLRFEKVLTVLVLNIVFRAVHNCLSFQTLRS